MERKVTDLFIVSGSTGIKDGRIDWPVVAFSNKDEAEEFADLANRWCADNEFHPTTISNDRSIPTWYEKRLVISNPYDSKFRVTSSGTNYYVTRLPFCR